MPISEDTQDAIDTAYTAQADAQTAKTDAQAANDAALQAQQNADASQAKFIVKQQQALDAANAAIAALMKDLGVPPPSTATTTAPPGAVKRKT